MGEPTRHPAAPSPRVANAPYEPALEAFVGWLVEQVAARVVAAAPPPPEPWIDVKAAAEHIAAPKGRVYRLVAADAIPHERDGARLLFRRSALDAWVEAGGGRT